MKKISNGLYEDRLDKLYTGLFFLVLALYLAFSIYFSSNPILDQHAFRQTQTALTAYWLKINGFSFSYETPVVGAPWSIPFEFPIYQWLVATISKACDFVSLSQIGRLVATGFTVLTCIPVFRGLSKLGVSTRASYLSLSLYLSSPIYLFWGSSFMIESAALFFTCSAIYYFILVVSESLCLKNSILLIIFASLALLQKITTSLPVFFLIYLAAIIYLYKWRPSKERTYAFFISSACLFVAVLTAYCWVSYSDQIKLLNPIGSMLSSGSLSAWNYGDFAQRISKNLIIDVIYMRGLRENSFLLIGSLIIISSIFFNKKNSLKILTIICLLLYISPFFIFTNLHVVHNYYQTANTIYLCIALAISLCSILDKFLLKKSFFYLLIGMIFIVSNLVFFNKTYFPDKKKIISIDNSRTLMLADFLKKNTSKESVIIVYGYDWSSELAFYSERKALTIPPWAPKNISSIKYQEPYLMGAPSVYVVCPVADEAQLRKDINTIYPSKFISEVAGCFIYSNEYFPK